MISGYLGQPSAATRLNSPAPPETEPVAVSSSPLAPSSRFSQVLTTSNVAPGFFTVQSAAFEGFGSAETPWPSTAMNCSSVS